MCSPWGGTVTPKGFRVPGQEHKVLHLLHALYGLKQAVLAWWKTLNESMKELGFECLKSDAGIFLYQKKGTNIVVAVVYVDDTLFCGPTKVIVDEIKGLFMKKWECRDLGPEVTEKAIHLRTALLILAGSVEWGNACHYPLKGHRQGKEIVKGEGQVYLALGTRRTGLQGKDQENLTRVLWWRLWFLYTTTMFVHVYARSLIRDKRDYCYWSSIAVSHSESEIRTSIAIGWK